jgi:hypothetical protein
VTISPAAPTRIVALKLPGVGLRAMAMRKLIWPSTFPTSQKAHQKPTSAEPGTDRQASGSPAVSGSLARQISCITWHGRNRFKIGMKK